MGGKGGRFRSNASESPNVEKIKGISFGELYGLRTPPSVYNLQGTLPAAQYEG